MKPMYIYDIGDQVDDVLCTEIIQPKKGSGKSTMYRMVCTKCGREKLMLGATLARHSGTTHAACGKGMKTLDKRFHSEWRSMRTRTTNPNYEHYDCYGGRGISSEAFKYFIDFYDVLYDSYVKACKKYGTKNVSLERIDNDGDYCPENCTWIPLSEQKSNQRKNVKFEVTFPDGHVEQHKNARKFAKNHNLHPSTFQDLLNGRIKTYKGFKGHRLDNKKCND